jgi:hypothetical protein
MICAHEIRIQVLETATNSLSRHIHLHVYVVLLIFTVSSFSPTHEINADALLTINPAQPSLLHKRREDVNNFMCAVQRLLKYDAVRAVL